MMQHLLRSLKANALTWKSTVLGVLILVAGILVRFDYLSMEWALSGLLVASGAGLVFLKGQGNANTADPSTTATDSVSSRDPEPSE